MSFVEVSRLVVNHVIARNFSLSRKTKAIAWSAAMAGASTPVRLWVTNQKFKRMPVNSLEVIQVPQSLHPPLANEEAYHSLLLEKKHYQLCLRLGLLVIKNWLRVQHHQLDHKEATSSQVFGSQARQNTTSSTMTAGNVFRVASVAMLTCGVDRNGLIRVSKAPSKNGTNDIQAMKNRGCYLEQQFVIESGWTYRKVASELRSWFPKVFEYLDVRLEKWQPVTLRSSHEDKPIWQLLNKSGQTLTVVDIGFPTGNDLVKHKGQDKASVSDCHLWFDSPDDSAGCKSDNDLASSLMELDMTSDTDVKDPKGKGKMKAVPAGSPSRSRNAKRSHTLLSPSPSEATTRRAAQKKLRVKKESASDTIPLFSVNSQLEPPPSTQPAQSNTSSHETVSFRTSRVTVPANELSSPPDFVLQALVGCDRIVYAGARRSWGFFSEYSTILQGRPSIPPGYQRCLAHNQVADSPGSSSQTRRLFINTNVQLEMRKLLMKNAPALD
ncbi:hypothetical protein EDB19DRAFT_1827597 [Suillus lakei]|nr:hypothetical protein EDB19DRAFT_1827597 [Suillus lakei]